MSESTLITLPRELFKKYIDEAYERGKKKGRAEAEAEHKKNCHKTVRLNDTEEFKSQIVEE